MKLLLHYLKPYVKQITIGMSSKLFSAIMDLLLPWILAFIIDSVIPQKSIPHILMWGGAMLVVSFLSISTNIVANRSAALVAKDTTGDIRHDLFTKISYLSTSQFEEIGIPTLTSRLTTDSYNIHQTLGMIQRMGIRAPILLLGGIAITATLDPVLTLVLVAVLPFTAITTIYISKKGIPLFAKLQAQVDVLVRTVRENVTGARVIKALSKTEYEKQRFEKVNQDQVTVETTANKTMAATPPLMNLFLNGGLTLVVLVSAFRVNAGLTKPGVIIAFLTYFTIILNAMLSITRIFVVISKGLASANRIRTILHLKNPMRKVQTPRITTPDHIVFDDVTFKYPNGTKALENIRFSLKPGETLGIIGATGSGKSTIIRLLLRLYDVTSGNIYINGENIKSLDLAQLHQRFGIVLQKDVLFAETIEENIDFGRHLQEHDIQLATEQAQAQEFIEQLPEHLDYPLQPKGSNLSGGQKQRVLLSRALAGNPEILILDDSASALDYHTDAQLRQVLRQDFSATTTILIAQRISSIQHADKIIVLEQGQIIGYGSHSELLATNPTYQEIYQGQTGGEQLVG